MAGLLDLIQSASNAVAGNVSGPVDMLAWGLRRAGLPIPSDPVGGAEWMRRHGLLRDVPSSSLVNSTPASGGLLGRGIYPSEMYGGENGGGVAPYGIRHSGEGAKGNGYFGPLKSTYGMSTEISTEDNSGEYPLMVPTLSKAELDSLLRGEDPSDLIYKKARDHADKRRAAGKNPFASSWEIRYPLPK